MIYLKKIFFFFKFKKKLIFIFFKMGVPIKWTAPEALMDQKYEANSDVYV